MLFGAAHRGGPFCIEGGRSWGAPRKSWGPVLGVNGVGSGREAHQNDQRGEVDPNPRPVAPGWAPGVNASFSVKVRERVLQKHEGRAADKQPGGRGGHGGYRWKALGQDYHRKFFHKNFTP